MRRTPLKAGTKRLPHQSAKKKALAANETLWRRSELERRPWCEIGPRLRMAGLVQGDLCTGRAVELHEIVKRSRGGSTTDQANCVPTCRPCHLWTECEPMLATQLGFLSRFLSA